MYGDHDVFILGMNAYSVIVITPFVRCKRYDNFLRHSRCNPSSLVIKDAEEWRGHRQDMYSFRYSRYILNTDNLIMFMSDLITSELNNMWECLEKIYSPSTSHIFAQRVGRVSPGLRLLQPTHLAPECRHAMNWLCPCQLKIHRPRPDVGWACPTPISLGWAQRCCSTVVATVAA